MPLPSRQSYLHSFISEAIGLGRFVLLVAGQCFERYLLEYLVTVHPSSKPYAGQVAARQLPVQGVHLFGRGPHPILQHQRDRFVNSGGDLLGPKIIISLIAEGLSGDHDGFNMAILHCHVLFSRDETCLY